MIRKVLLCLGVFVLLFLNCQDSSAQKKKKKASASKKSQTSVKSTQTKDKKDNLPPIYTEPQKLYYQTFEIVWKTINEDYYDPNFSGLNWNSIRAEYLPKIQNLKSDGELEQLLQEMLNQLNRSHLNIVPFFGFREIEKAINAGSKQEEERMKSKHEKKENFEEFGEDPTRFRSGLLIDLRILNSKVVITKIEKGSNVEKAGSEPGL